MNASGQAPRHPLWRKLYDLSQTLAGGAIRLERPDGKTAPLWLELRRGWVTAVDLSPAYSLVGVSPERGEDRLKLLLKVEDTYENQVHDPAHVSRRRGQCTPFHPAQTLRNWVDALRKDDALWRARVGAGRVRITAAPHASCVGTDERPLVAWLLQKERTLAELDATALCPPDRTQRLMAFLDAMGALAIAWDPGTSPYAALELPDGAPLDEVKKAYRRLARELHPDRHPGASSDDRLALERRFAEVSAAYKRLV